MSTVVEVTTDPSVEREGIPIIRIEGLRVRFDQSVVLDEVDVTVRSAEYVWLAGPNGAGKSTLLRVLAGLIRPESGQALIDGFAAGSGDGDCLVGYVPDTPLLYDVLTPREHLAFLARFWPAKPAKSSSLMESAQADLLARFGLNQVADVYARNLSLGQRQRLSLAVATFHRPSVLLLDEPFNGLDGATAALLRDLLADHVAGGGTAIVATHTTQHLTADRLLSLRAGRLVGDLALPPGTDAGRVYQDTVTSGTIS